MRPDRSREGPDGHHELRTLRGSPSTASVEQPDLSRARRGQQILADAEYRVLGQANPNVLDCGPGRVSPGRCLPWVISSAFRRPVSPTRRTASGRRSSVAQCLIRLHALSGGTVPETRRRRHVDRVHGRPSRGGGPRRMHLSCAVSTGLRASRKVKNWPCSFAHTAAFAACTDSSPRIGSSPYEAALPVSIRSPSPRRPRE
jgi:hypothetical protein